ncbi:SAM-dependent methyltransferase [Prosthecobacter sp.]|uniref:SAM-dependent methyltransferase n=1 Tax=Prosthecobacter sp. TaxID=1965333 RepID=UPI0037838D0A
MTDSATAASPTAPRPWLVRIPEILEGIAPAALQQLGAVSSTRLGQDYYLIKTATPEAIRHSHAAKFLRWNLPMDHTWPCNPQKMDGFIEKAAQTLLKKFGPRSPQGIFIGTLQPTSPDKYYKSLASNLRGRVLQLFPKLPAATVEEQDPAAETLFCLVGKEGLFCGMQSPRASNGLYAGGSKYIDQDSPDTISRAGAKIAEALHYLLLYRPPLQEGSHWIELGACPGGMTSELLARHQRVTAIDRAPLDKRLDGRSGLKFFLEDVAAFQPRAGTTYDALLCDMNGPPEESIEQVIRLSRFLKPGGLVVFTLKVPRIDSLDEPNELFRLIVSMSKAAGLHLFAQTHLTYNRHELTLFFETV